MKKSIRVALIVVLSAVLLYSVYSIYEISSDYAHSDAVFDEAVKIAVSTPSATPAESTEAIPGADTVTVNETPPISVDFDKLCYINPDIVGWLYCEGTPINYPVLQGYDNVYYLTHMYNGEHSRSGSLFLDYICSPFFSDDNSVIYGHHMKSGSMFASIVEYRSQQYYDEHPVMYLLTPEHNYRLDIFSGYVTDPGSESFDFETPEMFDDYVKDVAGKSDFKTEVKVTPRQRIITLSTCTYEYKNARYVLCAAVVPLG